MCHYLRDQPGGAGDSGNPEPDSPGAAEDDAAGAAWNRQVEAVDVDALADQVAATGAGWLIFTIGQNSGFYCSPNETFDSIVGRQPSRLSRRDLVLDLSQALSRHGIRTIAYLPSHAPADDRRAVEALECTPDWDASSWQLRPGRYLRTTDTDERLSSFQRNWEAIVREWSTRWGDAVGGWWIDGCYFGDRMYHYDDEPNLASFAAALRAGNPDAILAFNSGVRLVDFGRVEDYTAGESMHNLPVATWEGGYSALTSEIGGSQLHILTHLGSNWRAGDRPRFPASLVCGYTEYVASCGGAITWDVPIDAAGRIPGPFIDALRSAKTSPAGGM